MNVLADGSTRLTNGSFFGIKVSPHRHIEHIGFLLRCILCATLIYGLIMTPAGVEHDRMFALPQVADHAVMKILTFQVRWLYSC